ncbi:hypothetical protein [Natrinema salinisoli]|uniref:hypothetical protein n=1 Tax=Natrinema salinisoli TaxID=2878535 RepID=UPI001CEFDD93|nr:hypothetical protein [Natrinema salinisoli]
MSEDNTNGNSPGNKLTTRRGALAAFGTGAAALIGANGTASAASAEITIAVDPSQPETGKETSFTCTRAFAEYDWVIVGPSGFEQYTGRRVSTTFEEAGEYTAYLTVNQSNGESTYVSKSGQIQDQEPSDPVPTANFEFSPQDPVYNPITFDASESTTPSGEIESYDWYVRNTSRNSEPLFDDSPISSGETYEEGLSEGDKWQVGLEVTNSAGNTDRDRIEITPQENPDAPNPVVNIYPDEVTPQNPIKLDASESTTPVGTIESYDWSIRKYENENKIGELERSGEVIEENWETDVLHTFTLRVENSEGVSAQINDSFRPEE